MNQVNLKLRFAIYLVNVITPLATHYRRSDGVEIVKIAEFLTAELPVFLAE